MKKNNTKIVLVFLRIILIFMIVSMILSGIGIYSEQVSIHNQNTRELSQKVAKQIEYEIKADEDEFSEFVNFLIENRNDIDVNINFDNWDEAREKFDAQFVLEYPGKAFGVDVFYSDLSFELKKLYTIYNHAYYTLLFENYAKSFDLPYVYFVKPHDNGEVSYVIDAERIPREDNENLMVLADTDVDDRDLCPVMWKVWDAGIQLDEWDEFDNEYGKTYSYYVPLYIDNEKVGLICVDTDIDRVNSQILIATLRTVGLNSLVLLVGMGFFAFFFNRRIVNRISLLSEKIRSYTANKDPKTADEISDNIVMNDEISTLASYFADMIRQIDAYIKNISSMSDELKVEKVRSEMMNELANTDSLTGLHNRTAYINKEIELDKMINEKTVKPFGLVLIDLNFLKQINDENGHDKGDIALINTASLIRKVFGNENSYRIGGDEFVAIIYDVENMENKQKLFNKLMKEDKHTSKWEHISAAMGPAIYDSNLDHSVADVLSRADDQMYINKKKMKIKR